MGFFVLLFYNPRFCSCENVTTADSLMDSRTQENASKAAYNMFHLAVLGNDEEDNAHDDSVNIVFANGKVHSNWLPVSEAESLDDKLTSSLFHHDQYADRISFEFTFGSVLSYDIRTPTVSSSNQTIARPKVIDFQMEDEEQSGSFSVVYDCQRQPDEDRMRSLTLSVVFPVVSGLSLFYSFRKTCGGGRHEFIELGFFEDSTNTASAVSRTPFSSIQKAPVFGPHTMSTKIYIHLYLPATSQEFFHVNVTSSESSLVLHTRGPTFGGVVHATESAVVHILYDCRGTGVFDVYFSVPIFPFHKVSAFWKKDCGGGIAEGIDVGTSLDLRNDVVAGAVTRDRWGLALQMTTASIPDNAPTVNSSLRYQDFWISNAGIPVYIASAVVTVENPAVLVAISSQPDTHLTSPHQAEGSILPSGDHVRLRLRMICKKKGRSLVIVTLPIRSFSNIELGFVKQCNAPKRRVHSGFLRTASSAMATSTFFLTGAVGYWWVWHLRSVNGISVEKSSRNYNRIRQTA